MGSGGVKRGRKNAYDERIRPRFPEIAEWARKGVTEKSIAKQLGVAYSTFNKYKSEKPELMELLKNNRLAAVDDIENAMYKAAVGEKKVLKKYMKCKEVKYNAGKRVSEKETVVPYEEEVYIPPNTTAAIYLLKHWGRDRGYTNDPLTLELKNKEFKLKQEIAENNNW